MTQALPFTVVFEDEDLLVVNKPPGLASQPDRAQKIADVYTLLQRAEPYVGLHHRLDVPTSGLLLFTRSKRANRPIADAMQAHRVQRVYFAVVEGTPKGLTPDGHAQWSDAMRGKSARTDALCLGTGNGLSALRLTPHTGRTHQLRQHCAMHGAPIAGDRRYGGPMARRRRRLALHAGQMTLAHPMTGAQLTLTAPLDEAMTGLWQLTGAAIPFDKNAGA